MPEICRFFGEFMWRMNHVEKIQYVKDYIFQITFDDQMSGKVDFSAYLDKGPVFYPLKNFEFLQSQHVRLMSPGWMVE